MRLRLPLHVRALLLHLPERLDVVAYVRLQRVQAGRGFALLALERAVFFVTVRLIIVLWRAWPRSTFERALQPLRGGNHL